MPAVTMCWLAAALVLAGAAAATELSPGLSGGAENTASGLGAVVVGGRRNEALQDYSAAGGGFRNKVSVCASAARAALSGVVV